MNEGRKKAGETTAARTSQSRSGSAEISAVSSAGRVRLRYARDAASVDAQIALLGYDDPREGDRVVAMTDDDGLTWVVGVVHAPRTTSLLEDALEASEPTVVRDRRGRILFEYDPEKDRATLHVPSGDLEVSVPEGALRMCARDGVELHTDTTLTLDAKENLAVRAGELSMSAEGRVTLEAARGEHRARLAMDPGELTLTGTVVAVAADRAELLAARVGVTAQMLESHVDRVRSVAKVLDVRAGRIVERARDVYREVSGLSQTRAGRLRLVAKKTAQLVGENTLLKARDRMKVRGERIHLA